MKKHNSFLKNLVILTVFVLASTGLSAQINFSGTWAFNEAKSNFGDSQFRFAATSLVITQEGINLSVERTRPGRDGGEMKTTEKYTIDGKVCENPMFNTTRKSTLSWSADKSALNIASTMTFDMNGESREMKSSESWKLAEGGKLLMIDNVFTGPDGDMKTTVAYDKK